MHHKLDFRVLMKLHRRSLLNGEEDALVDRSMQRSDELAAHLSVPLLADYADLKRFFNALPFHEIHTRTYSWISESRQAFFFYPTVSAGADAGLRPSISMFVRADPGDTGLRVALAELGVSCDDAGSQEIVIPNQGRLDEFLNVIHRFHQGYILPDAATWQSMQQARRSPGPRDYCPVLLPLQPAGIPDCWL